LLGEPVGETLIAFVFLSGIPAAFSSSGALSFSRPIFAG